jgi:hypothetical protein
LVPIDVETQDLADVVANHGYWAERPTFFVWEAVTQYLTEAGVRKDLRLSRHRGSGQPPGFHLCRPVARAFPVSEIERSVCARKI